MTLNLGIVHTVLTKLTMAYGYLSEDFLAERIATQQAGQEQRDLKEVVCFKKGNKSYVLDCIVNYFNKVIVKPSSIIDCKQSRT